MPPKDVQGALEVVAKYVPASPTDAPVEFVRGLARAWKERGGFVAGKPRHSDRYLDDLLRQQGTPIRSLTPKLGGRTQIRPTDAGVLVRLFLSHWEYVGNLRSGEIGARSAAMYKPLMSDQEIEKVCEYIADRISAVGVEVRGEVESAPALYLQAQDTIDLIADQFQESAALFSAATGSPVVVPSPEMALIGFRELINRLWAIDSADSQERILVWTLDLGRQDFDDPESRSRFMNVQSLIIRFKALRRFKESVAEARWNWLQSRTVIVLHDTRSVRPEVPRLPAFDPHHVLFSAIPPKWAGSPEFLALYGSEHIGQANYTIFLRPPVKESPEATKLSDDISPSIRRSYAFRYFGHALLKSDENGERELRGLRLKAPGWSYVEALGTIFVAASQMLGLQGAPAELSIDGIKIDPTHALEKLRHHGFLLLRLDEFMTY